LTAKGGEERKRKVRKAKGKGKWCPVSKSKTVKPIRIITQNQEAGRTESRRRKGRRGTVLLAMGGGGRKGIRIV